MQVNGGAVIVWKGGEKKEKKKKEKKQDETLIYAWHPGNDLVPVRTSRHSMRQWPIRTRKTRVALAQFGATACDGDDLRWDVTCADIYCCATITKFGYSATINYPCPGDMSVITDRPRRRVHPFQGSDINTCVISLQWTPSPNQALEPKQWKVAADINTLLVTIQLELG